MVSTVATLTVMRGEIDRMPGLLENLAKFSERHFVETGDSTESLRQFAGINVHHAPLPWGAAFDAARNAAVPFISAPWVLIVDTDERVPPTLVDYLLENLPTWERDGVEGVFLPRKNHVLGYALKHSGSWPDYQLRFLRRDKVNFGRELHKFYPDLGKSVRGPIEDSKAIHHFSFENTRDYVNKINLYTSIEADQSTQSSSVAGAVFAAARDFASRYVRMGGFLDGNAGLHFAICTAFYRYLSVAKRWEKAKR